MLSIQPFFYKLLSFNCGRCPSIVNIVSTDKSSNLCRAGNICCWELRMTMLCVKWLWLTDTSLELMDCTRTVMLLLVICCLFISFFPFSKSATSITKLYKSYLVFSNNFAGSGGHISYHHREMHIYTRVSLLMISIKHIS